MLVCQQCGTFYYLVKKIDNRGFFASPSQIVLTPTAGGPIRQHSDQNREGGAGQDGGLVQGDPRQVGSNQGLPGESGTYVERRNRRQFC